MISIIVKLAVLFLTVNKSYSMSYSNSMLYSNSMSYSNSKTHINHYSSYSLLNSISQNYYSKKA